MMKNFLAKAYIWVLLVLLYAPMIIIGVFSFTEAKVLGNWTGFSTGLYRSLFTSGQHEALMSALINTLVIGLVAAIVSTVLGTVSAIGIYNLRNKRFKAAMNTMNNIPILNADIITGVSLFLLFVSLGVTQGYVTLTLCHITFCTPYVVLSVMPRLRQMNPNTFEAALDLGATPSQALTKVVLPQIKSGMVSGFFLSFILSIDDFEVSVFNIGTNGLQTLSTYIYADSRKGGLTPELRPMITIVFVAVLAVLIIMNLKSKKTNQNNSLK
jgi:spermidine/putrescine transport system permease protein